MLKNKEVQRKQIAAKKEIPEGKKMRDKNIGRGREKDVVIGSEEQAIADVKERVLLSEWQRQIEERQNGGYSIEEWCAMQSISKSCYYHRLRRVRKYLCQITGVLPEEQRQKGSEQKQIVPLKEITGVQAHGSAGASNESKVEVSCGEIKVAFRGSVEKELLQIVLEALRSC